MSLANSSFKRKCFQYDWPEPGTFIEPCFTNEQRCCLKVQDPCMILTSSFFLEGSLKGDNETWVCVLLLLYLRNQQNVLGSNILFKVRRQGQIERNDHHYWYSLDRIHIQILTFIVWFLGLVLIMLLSLQTGRIITHLWWTEKWPPKDVHVWIPGTCEYGKVNFANVIKLSIINLS